MQTGVESMATLTEKDTQTSSADVKPVLTSDISRRISSSGKPLVSLASSGSKLPVGLSLNDGDSLKTPTALGNTEVTLKTPTVLGSPTKGPLSAGAHVDELTTPKLSLNTYSTPTTQAQAFFGDHEPFLTG